MWRGLDRIASRCPNERLGLLLVAPSVDNRPSDKDAEPGGLEVRPRAPALAEAEHREDVEEDQVDDPDKQRAHRLQHRPEDGAEVVCDGHPRKVVGEQRKAVDDEDGGDRGRVGDHVQRVQRVLVEAVPVLARKEVGGRQQHAHHEDEANEPLVADDLERHHVQLAQEVVLKRELPSLHALGEDDEDHAQEDVERIDVGGDAALP
mmetsp:Transcript_33859/g.80375  ORF Transcript_33859/g.80375 Transcript_33859/m.80375 type:complete len:205 (-) Transcript_33859:702-1316(-)